eukprot:TRINITY_DN5621_c0_g1_i2.p1 TRINITY_DN5621_c0_g1~~TRINITY_DN5621_c0_g1_i2.p1  ORF type:complete len:102 (-),score=7.62 TRINITY_DN5621_c0_g1_i2:793-1098(-)
MSKSGCQKFTCSMESHTSFEAVTIFNVSSQPNPDIERSCFTSLYCVRRFLYLFLALSTVSSNPVFSLIFAIASFQQAVLKFFSTFLPASFISRSVSIKTLS